MSGESDVYVATLSHCGSLVATCTSLLQSAHRVASPVATRASLLQMPDQRQPTRYNASPPA